MTYRLQERDQLLDEVVDRLAGHDQHHHATRLLQLGDEILDGECTLHVGIFRLVLDELGHFGWSAVEHGNLTNGHN